ncbi:YceI family protein [Pedobacter sp. P351]|uniref:YceI family protein n=1 Tax=Pedobacter superstes TaxID=3133441 RepID=UPI0030A7663F
MLLHKPLLLIMLILVTGFSNQMNKPQVTQWVIMKGGSLKVDGSTNVNKFNCAIVNYAQPDTLSLSRYAGKGTLKISGFLKLDVQNFDCHHPIMTSDLRKTLKAKEFPKLTIRFLSLNKYPDLGARQELIKGLVTIELAGVTRRLEVDYKFLSSGENVINLIGTRKVNFSDFNIIPPRKIGGMIKTNNELSVVFNLRMKVID